MPEIELTTVGEGDGENGARRQHEEKLKVES
jgi:hypothetical protein